MNQNGSSIDIMVKNNHYIAMKIQHPKSPTVTDLIVAHNLQHYRTLKCIPLERAATHIGISYQQLQKYESGRNRISASRLWLFSKLYETPIDLFFNQIEIDKKT